MTGRTGSEGTDYHPDPPAVSIELARVAARLARGSVAMGAAARDLGPHDFAVGDVVRLRVIRLIDEAHDLLSRAAHLIDPDALTPAPPRYDVSRRVARGGQTAPSTPETVRGARVARDPYNPRRWAVVTGEGVGLPIENCDGLEAQVDAERRLTYERLRHRLDEPAEPSARNVDGSRS